MNSKKIWLIVSFTLIFLLLVEASVIFLFGKSIQSNFSKYESQKNLLNFSEVTAMKTFISVPLPQVSLPIVEVNSSPHVDNIDFPKYTESTNEIVDGWAIVKNPHSNLVVLNKNRKLPENFIPEQLIIPNVRFPYAYFDEKKQMKAVAALALEEMFKQAEEDGHILYAISAYRSFERQKSVHSQHIKSKGEKRAKEVSAVPGSSEHQTGLAIDISSVSQNFLLTTDFGRTIEGAWVAENAHRFGFIIRYPEDKSKITGYNYEPWHIRYVGEPFSTYLFENKLTLEETNEYAKKTP